MLHNTLDVSVAQIIMDYNVIARGSNSRRMSNTFYYRRTAIVLGVDKASLGASFESVVGSVFLAAANEDVTTPKTKIRWLNVRTDPTVERAMTGPGAIAGQRLPLDTTVVMNIGTNKRLPRYKSRKFFGGGNEADTTGDVLTGAGLGRWQSLRDALLLPLSDTPGNVWIPVTLQGALEGTRLKVNPCILYTEDVTTCVLNLNVSDLDRRHVVRAI